MIIRSITPQHIGPFSTPTKIEIDREVTVFTGPNDSGKSCALSAIRMFCARIKAEEHHVNTDRVGNHAGNWNSDPGVMIVANVEVTEVSISDGSVNQRLKSGDIISCRYSPNSPGKGYEVVHVKRGAAKATVVGPAIKRPPRVVEFNEDAAIKNVIRLAEMTKAENQLLKLGFGPKFVPESIEALNSYSRAMQIERAEEALNAQLKKFFPGGMSFEFRLTDIGGEGKLIGVNLVDGVRGFSPVEYRGTGVKRLLALMGLLLQEVNPNESTILLLDEPETSLHADAQHQLRRALEEIGRGPKVQVVYATHSPSMVNPAHPERVRVFTRHQDRDTATTKVSTPAYGENLQKVRVSLGLNPSDSLLYGLATILVEGDTEARCLGGLLRKLDQENVDGFEGLATLLESCHFVCGNGDSISYFCKLSADQNAKPIVFLDGDKPGLVKKLNDERPGVPIIALPSNTEFENIVPQARYIAALAECLAPHFDHVERLTNEAFDAWNETAGLPDRMMFSKRIDRWIEEVTGGSYSKHAVMEAAIRMTPANEFQVDGLRELARAINNQLM